MKNKLTFAEWMTQYHPKEVLLSCEYEEYRKDWVTFVGGELKAYMIELDKKYPKYKKVSIKNVIKKLIREDLRPEAMSIVNIASQYRINELIRYYNEGKDNNVCMHLDTIKKELVFYKLMEQKDTDTFGRDIIMP
jgi:hypothetical protein